MPGNESNCAAVAVFIFIGPLVTFALDFELLLVEVMVFGAPTMICSPSVSTWARLISLKSTPLLAPPAALSASIALAPRSNL